MKNYISILPCHFSEVAGLTDAICKQIGIPCNGMSDLGALSRQRDFINLIASKYGIDALVGNNLGSYSNAINLIANVLISRNILVESDLEQHLKEFLVKYPPVRL